MFCSQSSHWEVLCSQAEIISPLLLPVCWLTADMEWASSEQYRGLDMRMVQLHFNCSQYCLYSREAAKWCTIHPSLGSRPGTGLWLAQGVSSPLVLLAWIAPKQFFNQSLKALLLGYSLNYTSQSHFLSTLRYWIHQVYILQFFFGKVFLDLT